MVKYLGELEDDDLVMFVLEHLKDHKGPQKLVDGLEPVCIVCIAASVSSERNFFRCSKKRPMSLWLPYGVKSSTKVWPITMGYIQKEHSLIEQSMQYFA